MDFQWCWYCKYRCVIWFRQEKVIKEKTNKSRIVTSKIKGNNNVNIIGNNNQFYNKNRSDAILEIVDIDIDEHNEDGYPIIDIKLRNLGENAGFVKQVDIYVHDCFKMDNPNLTVYSKIDASHTYNTLLDLKTKAKALKVSQSVPASSVDRFQIVLASNHDEPEIPWIYELSFTIKYNSNKSIKSPSNYILPVRSNVDYEGNFIRDNSIEIAKNNYKNLKRFNDKVAIKSQHFIDIYESYVDSIEYFNVQ